MIEAAPPAQQDTPTVSVRLAEVDYRVGDLDAARASLEGVIASVSAADDPVLRARAMRLLGAITIRQDRSAEALPIFGEAVRLTESAHEPSVLGQAYTGLAAALINLAENLFLDLRPKGVGVSLVNPGFVDTPLTAQNQFTMPSLITPEQAALAIVRGWERGAFESHFPKRFTGVLRFMRCLPYRWYFPLVHRFTGL